jgi:hypothetical protein
MGRELICDMVIIIAVAGDDRRRFGLHKARVLSLVDDEQESHREHGYTAWCSLCCCLLSRRFDSRLWLDEEEEEEDDDDGDVGLDRECDEDDFICIFALSSRMLIVAVRGR